MSIDGTMTGTGYMIALSRLYDELIVAGMILEYNMLGYITRIAANGPGDPVWRFYYWPCRIVHSDNLTGQFWQSRRV